MILIGLILEQSLEDVLDNSEIQGILIASGKGILDRHAGYGKPMLQRRAGVFSCCYRCFEEFVTGREDRAPAAEAKNANDASLDTLRITRHLTTPEDWPQSTGY